MIVAHLAFQEEMVKKVRKVILVFLVPLDRSFQGQELVRLWDQKAAKDFQDFLERKGIVAFLACRAPLVCQELQESQVQAHLVRLVYLGREDKRGIKAYLGFPYRGHLELMDNLDPLAYQAHLAHLEQLFHRLTDCVSEGPLALQASQESKDLVGREARKEIKETRVLTA